MLDGVLGKLARRRHSIGAYTAMPHFELTPAVERAVAAAVAWRSAANGQPADLAALLMGLLSESECRAAAMLSRHGVTWEAVQRQWPDLRRRRAGKKQAAAMTSLVNQCVLEAQQWLPPTAQGVSVATEHLLLGMVAGKHPVGQWLRGQGLEAEALGREIGAIYGARTMLVETAAAELAAEPVKQKSMVAERSNTPDPKRQGSDGASLEGSNHALRIHAQGVPPAEKPQVQRSKPEVRSPKPEVSCPTPEVCSPRPEVPSAAVYRLLDAAANRAREGLRVVEDYVRFVRDDGFITQQLKQLRHDLSAALATLPADHLLISRDATADVGTSVSTEAEQHRADASSVATANFKRLQEALRSLEEFGKLHDPQFAGQIEQLRYRSYTLERLTSIARRSSERLRHCRLYVLIDGRGSVREFDQLAAELIAAGVHILQLRDKRLEDRELLERAGRLRELTRGTSTLFIMNDRADLALLAEADGVHLGQEELSVHDARRIVSPDRLIGVSTHSMGQARQAVLDGADYLGLGPTFPSETKPFSQFPGLEFLRQAAAEISLPAFAIGGISLQNLPQVLATGIRSVAISGAITAAASPAEEAKKILAELRRASG